MVMASAFSYAMPVASSAVPELTEAFVRLADTLVDEFDLAEFLHALAKHAVGLLGVDSAGILLIDHNGQSRVVGASDETARTLELLELQNDEGPSLDCYRGITAVVATDPTEIAERWPVFAAAAAEHGVAAVHALPMRLRSTVIGSLNLFRFTPGQLDPVNARIGQALADIATIGLLQERAVRHRDSLAEQLQTALHGRVVIEQAKGVLSERLGVDMAAAFEMLRRYARNHSTRVTVVATGIVDRTLSVEQLTTP